MPEQPQYSPVSNVPLIKSPSLRVPRPVELPPDIHPLPDSVSAYFVYPFTLEPHVLTLESARRSTLSAHAARHMAYLRQREEEKERRRREALRRIAPGFEPTDGPLVPTKVAGKPDAATPSERGSGTPGHTRQKSVMEDLVDHLAALDTASTSKPP
ncbi:hypothetical protein BD410DRAFT_785979 [Rickenella mellea]|uniref:Uncharacterized protein n=1 Tax=Rickenella mellea TaxID=50990 RepID=A0A4Y7QB83_9AGAM|nr:hypothetical protein BD410DRAFT_785979 [Rickenella mellea]